MINPAKLLDELEIAIAQVSNQICDGILAHELYIQRVGVRQGLMQARKMLVTRISPEERLENGTPDGQRRRGA